MRQILGDLSENQVVAEITHQIESRLFVERSIQRVPPRRDSLFNGRMS